jgi:NitT/TauT family transport system permease protein
VKRTSNLPLVAPVAFGLTVAILWQAGVTAFDVPSVLLPAPSIILSRFFASLPTLAADFVQTVLRAAIPGWLLGSGFGFVVALACDRVPFLRRGLLPLGSFVSALPIVGIAPIMVMWFGFDWQSKVAVVVAMTFFPMLVNMSAGLEAAGTLERDLMATWAASWWAEMLRLRLPAAMPFFFNGLKMNASLAMIGAIVAEFFGTPVVGMGFRISTGVGRMQLDLVWAEITLAAIIGLTAFFLLTRLERRVAFWHPSVRDAYR